MNIGIVCYPTFGGSGVVATELGLALAKEGHQVHFITYSRPARLSGFRENVFYHEVTTMDYPVFDFTPYESALASKLVDVATYAKLDVLHVHYAVPHASVAYLAKRILKNKGHYLPVITTLHGTDITLVGTDRSFKSVVEFGINESDGVTAVSEYLRNETYNTFDVKHEIEVIYNFIDFDRFNRANKRHFRDLLAPNGEHILMHTSNFRKVKRVKDTIDVLKKVRWHHPAILLLVGDGPERPQLERLSRSEELTDCVRFLGKQDAIEELLSISDVFLLPSANESFGLSALEAMACEVPVVSSNIGGLPEVNVHGETGYLCDVGDTKAMAKACCDILESRDILNSFRKRALQQAQRFNIADIVKRYEKLYKRVAQESS
ncbi:MAG: N-acetyl-alpha-D-glucosaminyl L-malate synthase BshA [Bacteroidetes bacterium]|jgi:N-acetyl-alpha-D-glucosaminyl L-malate synthase BshA|nr:N-acetyl-alpha-D-glucosaminyl L-malate synthase BshA [Bacteroidota bacterium]